MRNAEDISHNGPLDGRTVGNGHELDGSDVREVPTKDLLTSLFEQGKVLVQEEVRLAKSEMRAEVKKVTASAGAVGGGALLLLTGWLVFSAFLVVLLDLFLPLWAAALIVSVLFLGVGAAMAMAGIKKLKNANLKPTETIETLREDKEWLRKTMRAATSNTRATA